MGTKRPRPKAPMVTSKAHTVLTFPTAVFKSSPTPLTTPTDSSLMSNMKEQPYTPKRNPTNLLPLSTPLLPPTNPPVLKLSFPDLKIVTSPSYPPLKIHLPRLLILEAAPKNITLLFHPTQSLFIHSPAL